VDKQLNEINKIFEGYSPFLDLTIENENYILQTAKTVEEFAEVFKMRQEVFAPVKEGKENAVFEYDRFDSYSDHMIIIHKESQKICGTYRIICSERSSDFYSESEFNLEQFKQAPGIKLECGRACVLPEYRSGAIIALLWRGLAHYIDKSGAQFLFGCSSVDTTDKKVYSQVLQYLKDNCYSDEYNVQTIGKFQCEIEENVEYDQAEMKALIPPLLRTYQACGAKIHGPPALDTEFSCVDFLTILDMDKLNQAFWNRFFR
jgi:putative hemolysin